MSAAYETLRKALEGTQLEGKLADLNAALGLTPEAPEWVISVLSSVGTIPMEQRLAETERRIDEALAEIRKATDTVAGKSDEIAQPIAAAVITGVERNAKTAHTRIEFSSILHTYILIPLFIVTVIALSPSTRIAEIRTASTLAYAQGKTQGEIEQRQSDTKYYRFSIHHGGPR